MLQSILTQTDIEQIHATSIKLLETSGIEFPYGKALKVFEKHGIKTDGTRVFLTEKQLMDALQTVPKQFTIEARNPELSVTVGDGNPVFAPAYGAPFIVDAQVGKRAPTMEDYDNLVKIAHALPNQDMSGILIVEPGDVDSSTAHLQMLHAHMVHSDKPFIGSAAGTVGAQDTMEMAKILFDGDVDGRPVTICLINSLSPLGYSTEMLEALVEYARLGQPMVVAALMMAGSTGPITLAGVLTTQNAELLAGVALTQLIRPGCPVVYGSTSTNIDMASGALAIGSPELSQMITAHAQLARHYGLPCRSGGALTDSSCADAQAGFESMMSLMTTVNSGVDFVLHSAGILSSYLAFSIEKFVMDDEMCGMVRSYHQGIEISPQTLAHDVIAKVGPGGNYLMEMHTVKRCRTEFWKPALCDRGGLETWMASGMETSLERARRRWQKLVQEHADPELDGSVAQRLEQYVAERLT